jgi:hypothetical protein
MNNFSWVLKALVAKNIFMACIFNLHVFLFHQNPVHQNVVVGRVRKISESRNQDKSKQNITQAILNSRALSHYLIKTLTRLIRFCNRSLH